MALNFDDPNTVNALSMALGFVGQAFAQNPQQAAMANQAVQLAQGQQRSQLLSNLLAGGGTTPVAGGQGQAGYASQLTPEEIDQAPTAMAAGLGQPTAGAQTTPTLGQDVRMSLLSQLLGGGQTPFGLTQRR